jgi:hypothetical protein
LSFVAAVTIEDRDQRQAPLIQSRGEAVPDSWRAPRLRVGG